MQEIYNDNVNELSADAVDIFVEAVQKILSEKDEVVVAIPGGRSVQGMWKLLAKEGRIPWEKIHIFMADERVVMPEHEDSNFRLAEELFIGKLVDEGKLPVQNVNPFTPADSEDKGSKAYTKQFNEYGGNVDILILGVGEDGHVGALYPNHHSIKSDEEGYIVMDDSPKPPPVRMTMSRNTMLTAHTALLLFIGDSKADAYQAFIAGDDFVQCPARLAKQIPEAYVLTTMQNT